MKQYQVWVMITLLAAIAGVLIYANFKGEKTPEVDAPKVIEE